MMSQHGIHRDGIPKEIHCNIHAMNIIDVYFMLNRSKAANTKPQNVQYHCEYKCKYKYVPLPFQTISLLIALTR